MKEKAGKAVVAAAEPTIGEALKAAALITGIGLTVGVVLVLGMNKVMKELFVDEEWPEEEWSGDDWAEEDLD